MNESVPVEASTFWSPYDDSEQTSGSQEKKPDSPMILFFIAAGCSLFAANVLDWIIHCFPARDVSFCSFSDAFSNRASETRETKFMETRPSRLLISDTRCHGVEEAIHPLLVSRCLPEAVPKGSSCNVVPPAMNAGI